MQKSRAQTNSHEELRRRRQVSVNSGRIGERLVIRTTTVTGQGLRYTLTRPLRSPQSHQGTSDLTAKHMKSSSDGAFQICVNQDEVVSELLRSLSMDHCAGFSKKPFRTLSESTEDNREFCGDKTEKSLKHSTETTICDTNGKSINRRKSFLEGFQNEKLREFHIKSNPIRKASSSHLPPLQPTPSSSSKASTSHLASFKLPSFFKNSGGNSGGMSLVRCKAKQYRSSDSLSSDIDYGPERKTKAVQTPATYLLKRRSLSYQRAKQQTMTPDDVRLRRRESADDGLNGIKMHSRCISTPQSLNRSIPCVYENTQFSTIRSSYLEGPPTSGRTRTAVVGPNTARNGEGLSSHNAGTMELGDVRSYCSSDITRAYTSPTRCEGDPPPYYLHRRSTQPEDGSGVYQISGSTPLSRSARCEFGSGGASSIDSVMMPRATRPRDLRVIPAPPPPPPSHTEAPKKHGSASAARGTINEVAAMHNISNAKKIMVAPQPQNSTHHHRERSDASSKSAHNAAVTQRRQSCGAVVPAYGSSHHGDSLRSRDSPMSPYGLSSDRVLNVDDRCMGYKNSSDMRVAVLEQRVRELEAAMIAGQLPSTSTSFVIPVIGNSRIIRSASGQFIMPSSSSTQQLMAQEIVEREVECERLQSQLRKCHSRMELRQVQYDEEVNIFRRESEEAKAQLAKVKARLSELEHECATYRAKAIAVDANRNDAVASSVERISSQDRELANLRSELDKNVQLLRNMENVKRENEFLELQNEALSTTLDKKEATIRDLEDNVMALKMEISRKLDSGSVTPKAESFSMLEIESPKVNNENEMEKMQSVKKRAESLSDLANNGITSSSKDQTGCCALDNGKQLAPITSKLIRKQLSCVLECRLLAKCLKDIAAKAISGDAPSVDRLLGRRTDSMSESEPEPFVSDATPMSMGSAERHIKKVTEDIERIEKDLNILRESFIEYYQKKIADELREDEACRIQ